MTTTFTRAGALEGARDVIALMPGSVLFGMLFGLMAADAGLSILETVLMSAIVFAGASQFAAMQIWVDPVAVLLLIFSTFAINARHLVMGAVLAPWLRPVGRLRAFVALFFMVDESWGLSAAKLKRGGTDAAYLLGAGGALYPCWIGGSLAGRVSGGLVPDPSALALDFLPVALFLALLMNFWNGPKSLPPWLVAAATAVIAARFLGPGWPVLLGALAGALAGAAIDTMGEEKRP